MLGPALTLQFTTYDGAMHWRHDVERLGEDEHGVWLAGPVGSTAQAVAEMLRGRHAPFDGSADRWLQLTSEA